MVEAERPEPIIALTAGEPILGAVVEHGIEVEDEVIFGPRAGAKDADTLAVGDGLGPHSQDGGDAAEVRGVAIGAANHDFVAFAGDGVPAKAADEQADAAAADDGVVAVAAVEHGPARAATERVVAVAAVDHRVDGAEVGKDRDRIVAAIAVDDDAVDRRCARAAGVVASDDTVDNDTDER